MLRLESLAKLIVYFTGLKIIVDIKFFFPQRPLDTSLKRYNYISKRLVVFKICH